MRSLGWEARGLTVAVGHRCLRLIAEAGRGVIVLLRDAQLASLSRKLEARQKQEKPSPELRDYGVGAQILLDLGVREMILLSNSRRTIVGLEGYGLHIAGQRPIEAKD